MHIVSFSDADVPSSKLYIYSSQGSRGKVLSILWLLHCCIVSQIVAILSVTTQPQKNQAAHLDINPLKCVKLLAHNP